MWFSLFHDFGVELGCRLEVLDLAAWHHAFAPERRLAAQLRAILNDTVDRCAGRLPAILRLDLDGHAALTVPVPSRRAAALLASRFTESAPELSVLQHVSTVAALELERLVSERDARSRSGAELLGALLGGSLDEVQAEARLAAAGLASENLVLAAWSETEPRPRPAAIHLDLYARGLAHLLRPGDGDVVALALLPDTAGSRRMLRDALGDDHPLGLSAPVARPGRLAEAAREARWAQQSAASGRSVVRYGEDEPPSWAVGLERSQQLADHVLGPLISYDRSHQTELVRTPAVLLRNNRASTRTASDLFIHRQTLVYRIRRIEQLTGRSLSRTKDVVDLWLALRAVEVVDGARLLDA